MLRTLVNVEPVNEIRTVEEIFDRLFGQPSRPVGNVSTLPIDVTEKDGSLYIRAAVPGVNPSELDITVENNVLSIRGESRNSVESEKEKVYRREVTYGSFSRSVRLPEKLDLENVQASFNHGMVTVQIPRLPESKPQIKRIEVKTESQPSGETSPQE